MIFSQRHSIAFAAALGLPLVLAACASPQPSRVAVTMMGTRAHGDTTTISARAGDTVYTLAQHMGVDVRALIDSNNLQPPYALSPGQRIKVPAPETVQVNEGDTLFSIARAYSTDQSELVRLNNLTPPYNLSRGQQLKLPSTVSQITTVTETAEVVTPPQITSETLPPVSSGPIATTENANGSKTHSSSAGVITEETLAPPPGATSGTGNLGATTQLPPPPKEVAAAKPASNKPALGAGVPKFSWPTNGSTLSEYGPKAGGRHNDGINIGAPLGSPVRAAAAGEVVYAGDNVAGFGNLVLVRHSGGYASAYGHLQNPLVKRGDMVDAGQAIAQVGKTGNVSTPQLHFEIRKGTQAVNPKPYLP